MSTSRDELRDFLGGQDNKLASVIANTPYPTYNNTHDVFEDLVSCILDMRIHYAGSSAAFRYKRLKKLLNGGPLTPELLLDPPAGLLEQLKLSRQKDESLFLWATKWQNERLGDLDWPLLSEEDVTGILTDVKGVSYWTAQVIMLFTLERPDIFPARDYQLKKAMCAVYELDEDNTLEDRINSIAAQWQLHRSLACRYLWAWRERNRRATLRKE